MSDTRCPTCNAPCIVHDEAFQYAPEYAEVIEDLKEAVAQAEKDPLSIIARMDNAIKTNARRDIGICALAIVIDMNRLERKKQCRMN